MSAGFCSAYAVMWWTRTFISSATRRANVVFPWPLGQVRSICHNGSQVFIPHCTAVETILIIGFCQTNESRSATLLDNGADLVRVVSMRCISITNKVNQNEAIFWQKSRKRIQLYIFISFVCNENYTDRCMSNFAMNSVMIYDFCMIRYRDDRYNTWLIKQLI